jgi:diguanylate cyclase (GGDEF)-like protein
LAASEELLRIGEHPTGSDYAAEAVTLAQQLGNREAEGRAALLMATHEHRRGRPEECLAAAHSALAAFSELEDLQRVSAALNQMVLAFDVLGLSEESLDRASRSLEAAKMSGDPLTLAWAYNRAGLGHAAVGNVEEGITSLQFALSLAREVGDSEAIFAALNNLMEDYSGFARELFEAGQVEEARERVAPALELAPEAIGFARALDNPYDESIIQLTIGRALSYAGRYEEAIAELDAVESVATANGYGAVRLECRYERAHVELMRGDLREAISCYHALLSEKEKLPGYTLVNIHLDLWRAHKQLGEYREALEHHERFHAVEQAQQTQLARTRARVLSSHLDLDRAHLEARKATLEAELERSRTRELEVQAHLLREQTEVLIRRADEDGLTGVWNRRHVEREMPRLMREAAVRGEPVGVAFVDADRFKGVNDRYGHLVGDDVLRALADLLQGNCRPTDVVARMGGEEFVVLLPGADAEAARLLGERLCSAVREADWEPLVPGTRVTVSVGVASDRPGRMTSREIDAAVAALLSRADEALYAAKRAGRDRVVLAPAA